MEQTKLTIQYTIKDEIHRLVFNYDKYPLLKWHVDDSNTLRVWDSVGKVSVLVNNVVAVFEGDSL